MEQAHQLMGVGTRGAEAPQFYADLTVKWLVSMKKVGNRSYL